jgi:hypothetical protein
MTDDEQSREDTSVRIDRADQGWIVSCGPRLEVVEEEEMAQDGEAQATARLLYVVLDMIGELGTKHDDYRVRIGVIERDSGRDLLGHFECHDHEAVP